MARNIQSDLDPIDPVILFDHRLTVGARAAYLVMKCYEWTDGDETAYSGGHAGLAKSLDISLNGARRYLNELVAAGYLKRHRQGLGKNNIYTFLDPERV